MLHTAGSVYEHLCVGHMDELFKNG